MWYLQRPVIQAKSLYLKLNMWFRQRKSSSSARNLLNRRGFFVRHEHVLQDEEPYYVDPHNPHKYHVLFIPMSSWQSWGL
jgi:hypothetical protein